MARAQRIEFAGAIYHVTTRGDNKEPIFVDDPDRNEYLRLLVQAKEKQGIKLFGFCLMDNHTHLVLQTEMVELSKVMHRLNNLYAHYFNQRHGRVGHLFQERYFAKLCVDDKYLLAMLSYVDLNPVSAGLVSDPIEYRWSSHQELASPSTRKLIDKEFVMAMFSSQPDQAAIGYRQFVMGIGAVKAGVPVETWVNQNDEQLNQRRVEGVGRQVARCYSFSWDDLVSNKRNQLLSEARGALACILVEHDGMAVSDVARVLAKTPAAIHTALGKRQWDEEIISRLLNERRKAGETI